MKIINSLLLLVFLTAASIVYAEDHQCPDKTTLGTLEEGKEVGRGWITVIHGKTTNDINDHKYEGQCKQMQQGEWLISCNLYSNRVEVASFVKDVKGDICLVDNTNFLAPTISVR